MDRQNPEGKARVLVRSWGKKNRTSDTLSAAAGLSSCQPHALRQRLAELRRVVEGRANKGQGSLQAAIAGVGELPPPQEERDQAPSAALSLQLTSSSAFAG